MSDHNVSCFATAPAQCVMLGSREMYASIGGAEELVGGPDTPSEVTVSFDLQSREAVDELVERAGAAGGRIGDTDDYFLQSWATLWALSRAAGASASIVIPAALVLVNASDLATGVACDAIAAYVKIAQPERFIRDHGLVIRADHAGWERT